jgi:hypothetical protein
LSWDVDAWRKWIAATRLNPQPSELQAAASLKLFETIGNASPADLARIVKGMFLSRNDDPYFCAVTLAFLAAIETMKKVLSGAPPAMTLDDAARRLIDE